MAQSRRRLNNLLKKIRGSFLTMSPFILTALAGMSTLVVDVGVMRVTHAELQNATDAAALAAANALGGGLDAAAAAASNALALNPVLGNKQVSNLQITYGSWDSNTGTFNPNSAHPDTVQISASVPSPEFFSSLFSTKKYNITSSSTASLATPKDIIFIVDLGPAMNEYSQFQGLGILNAATVVNNLQAVYNAMNLPQLGSMTWTPQLLLGSANTIKTALGITRVAYPFPGGSWNSYINYVKTDPTLALAGYSNMYGYLTFVNYLQAVEPEFSQTPTLWKTPEEPLQSVKTSLDNFISQDLTSADEVGLITYDYTSENTVAIEQHLTSNLGSISAIMDGNPGTNKPGRQAGNYSMYVDMDVAIQAAITDLINRGRQGTQKVIVLITASAEPDIDPPPEDGTIEGIADVMRVLPQAVSNNISIDPIAVTNNVDMTVLQNIAQTAHGSSVMIAPMSGDFSQTINQLINNNLTAQIVK